MRRQFAVGDRALCAWGAHLQQENLDFLENLDPDFFLTAAESLASVLNRNGAEPEHAHAALALRLFYSHAIEALLSLVAAAVQAPDCVVGWMCEYREPHLQHVLQCLATGCPFFSKLRLESFTWEELSGTVHSFLKLDDKDKGEQIKQGYAGFWQRAAALHMDEVGRKEYNSIKHGLRARSGGFTLRTRRELSPGVPDPTAPVTTMASSKFGSSFFISQPIAGTRSSLGLRRCSTNWQPQALIDGIELAAMSIANVAGFLRIVNGVEASGVQFSWPADLDLFDRAWDNAPGQEHFTVGPFVDHSAVAALSRDEILSVYSNPR